MSQDNLDRPPTMTGGEDWELFLVKLRYRPGNPLRIAANQPLVMDDAHSIWIAFSDDVDVFAVRTQRRGTPGTRRYLFTARAGSALFGVTPADQSILLLVSGKPGTEILKVEREDLVAFSKLEQTRPLIANLVDKWIAGLSAGIIDGLPPRDYLQINAGQEYEVTENTNLRTLRQVIWLSHTAGHSEFAAQPAPPLTGTVDYFPIAHHSWIKTTEPSTLITTDSETLMEQDKFWKSLDHFHQFAATTLQHRAMTTEEFSRQQFERRMEAEIAQFDGAVHNLASLLHPSEISQFATLRSHDPLFNACRIIGNHTGIIFKPGIGATDLSPVDEIARASGVRIRRVALRGDWWRVDNGPLLAHLEESQQPVALIPTARGYEIHDPINYSITPVTEELSYMLRPFAYTFYRPLPNKKLSLFDLLRFGFRGTSQEIRTLVIMGTLSGLVALVTPVITGFLFDTLIPASQRSQLVQVGLALFVSALAITLFDITRGAAMLRLETRAESTLQAAVMDRLLNLPTTFFRDYTAGDLGQRALGISFIRSILSQQVLAAVLSLVFSIFSLIILFAYDNKLALIALALVLVLMIVMFITTFFQIGYQREYTALQGRFSGTTLQLINGIGKLRVAGAQRRAFARWADLFAGQQRATFKAQLVGTVLSTFNEFYTILVLMIIFGVAAGSSQAGLSTGSFLAFITAFSQFMIAAFGVGGAITSMIAVIPLYERAKPILETLPETDEDRFYPGELTGSIDVSRVSFRYEEDGPLVLDNVSLEFHPGEFVAIVGPSGSGKSTLLRLLLGFESPGTGTILYDKQDLSRLDIHAVRRQMGVVLQDGKLFTGSILSNIVGSAPLTIDDAWAAAEKAGFAKDIKLMPMGMHTLITEGGGTISGGQRQRLLIARAIVRKPRIIIFDEATSALDNETQALVSQSLEALDATRIVIAHRLSTIANADRIYVFKDGRVIQHGTYEELLHERGLFADLAKRQLA